MRIRTPSQDRAGVGDDVTYLDSHLREVAWNPRFELNEGGEVVLP